VDATANFLAAVAQDLAARPGVEDCKRLLALAPKATDWYRSVDVAGPDGRVYCGTTASGFGRPMKPVHVSGATWFRQAQRKSGFVLGEFGSGPLSGRDALIGSHRVGHGSGMRPAVLFAAFDVERLAKMVGFHGAPKGTTFALLDHRGTVVARQPPGGLVGRRLPERPLVETVLRRPGLDAGARRGGGRAPRDGERAGAGHHRGPMDAGPERRLRASRGCRGASPPPRRPRGRRLRASRTRAGDGSSRWWRRGAAAGRCPVRTCRWR